MAERGAAPDDPSFRRLLLVALVSLLLGCQQYAGATPRRFLESDDAANYARVFREPVPRGVDIVRSVVIDYDWRPGIVATDDYAFELLAPRAWVTRTVEALRLRPGAEAGKSGARVDRDVVVARQKQPIRPWYAPGAFEVYRVWLSPASVPYVHLLMERRPLADGRVRVFVSKH